MAFGRRRDLDKKIKKNLEIISSIITNIGNKYINENITIKLNFYIFSIFLMEYFYYLQNHHYHHLGYIVLHLSHH